MSIKKLLKKMADKKYDSSNGRCLKHENKTVCDVKQMFFVFVEECNIWHMQFTLKWQS